VHSHELAELAGMNEQLVIKFCEDIILLKAGLCSRTVRNDERYHQPFAVLQSKL